MLYFTRSFLNVLFLLFELIEVLVDFRVIEFSRNDWLTYLFESFKFAIILTELCCFSITINPVNTTCHIFNKLILDVWVNIFLMRTIRTANILHFVAVGFQVILYCLKSQNFHVFLKHLHFQITKCALDRWSKGK